MSYSYSGNRIPLVFSTKNREKQITEELQLKLWPYMAVSLKITASKP